MVNDLFPRSVMVLTVGGHHHESPQQRSRSQWQWRSLITQDTNTPPALAWDSFYISTLSLSLPPLTFGVVSTL